MAGMAPWLISGRSAAEHRASAKSLVAVACAMLPTIEDDDTADLVEAMRHDGEVEP